MKHTVTLKPRLVVTCIWRHIHIL